MEIIKKLSLFSTSIISDALNLLWLKWELYNFKSYTSNKKIVWVIYTIKYRLIKNNENLWVKNYIEDIPNNKDIILFIDNWWIKQYTVWWEILTLVAKIKWIKWTIINWVFRDLYEINNMNFPVFSKGVFMKSWKWYVQYFKKNCKLNVDWVEINSWDYVLWDSNGLVIIPKKIINIVLEKAEMIVDIESKIKQAVLNWIPLKIAREKYNYNFHIWKQN